jgi:hypothetical protein
VDLVDARLKAVDLFAEGLEQGFDGLLILAGELASAFLENAVGQVFELAPQPPDQGAEGQRCQPEQDRDDLGAAQLGTGQPGNDVTRVHAAPGDVDGARARAPPGAV